jgi:hydrogenase nickel incorporation protein HypA/HybF
MHELSIAMSLVDCVCEELPRVGPDVRLVSVRVRVGALSGVVREALAFAFDVAASDSGLAGVPLDIEETPGSELELVGLEVRDGDPHC